MRQIPPFPQDRNITYVTKSTPQVNEEHFIRFIYKHTTHKLPVFSFRQTRLGQPQQFFILCGHKEDTCKLVYVYS